MAERGPLRRNRGVGVLLMAAAPLLVVGGHMVSTHASGDDALARPAAQEVAEPVAGRTTRVPESVPVPVPGAQPASTSPGRRPDTVVVPSLGVRATVTPIATQGGALTPPSDPRQVGWWSGGARPGSSAGAAVITGHTVHTGGGAFDDLERLRPGDPVVVRGGAEEVAFEVRSVRVLSRAELARENARIFGRSGAPRLVLITCEDWDGTAYRSNVVVTAQPVG